MEHDAKPITNAQARAELVGNVLDSAPIGIALFDRERRYVHLNAALAQINNLPREAHLGRRIEDVLPHLSAAITPLLLHVLSTGEAIFNNPMHGRDADTRHWLATYYPVKSSTNDIVGVGVLVLEATALQRAEEELRHKTHELEAANARLELLSRASAILASSLDIETTLQSVAHVAVPAFADWCLVDLAEPDGTLRRVAVAHIEDDKSEVAQAFGQRKVPPQIKTSARHGIARVRATGDPDVVERVTEEILCELARDATHLRLLRALQMTSYISVPLAARGHNLGVLTFAACGARQLNRSDVALATELALRAGLAIDNAKFYSDANTARQRAEAEQQRAEFERTRAQEAAHAKDEFLSILSHELRTPLTSACGWLQLHRGGKLDVGTQEFALDTIERALSAQSRLVSELLDSSHLQGGRMSLRATPVALVALVEETLANLQAAALAKNLRFECSLADVTVRGDAGRLLQIIWNLLSNAVKFSLPDSAITVHLDAFEAQARLHIIDTGQGIAPEFMAHLFEPFRQAEGSSTRVHGGLGLGLSVARGLAELHGGTIEARSAGEGHGAMFTLLLPRVEDIAAETALPIVPVAGLLSGLQILIVEDEEDTRSWMELALTVQGALVSSAATVRAGLEVFFSARPDVIVSDISLPDGDGYTLLQHIRDSEKTALRETQQGVAAIALTAHTTSSDRLRALAAGFQIHIPKPVEPHELVMTVAAVAGRSIPAQTEK